ncbi:MAG: Ig-like domain-containing protein [Firmicutes bacterium]|nr:Ig-like domain-containing protein [Bacillota bacterium]
MKKTLKWLFIALLTAFAVSFAAVYTACDKKDGDDPEPTVVEISQETLTLDKWDEATLTATSTGSAVTWSSSDTTVAVVNGGTVVGLKAGKATVTASADGESASCEVTVNDGVDPVLVTGVTGTLPLAFDGSYTVTPAVLFKSQPAAGATIAFETEGKGVISVVKSGNSFVISAVKAGTEKLTLIGTWRGITADCIRADINVEVDPKVQDEVTISDASANVYLGETLQLSAISQLGLDIEWSTSNALIATVDEDGLVEGIAVGTVTITATSTAGAFATCTVEVELDEVTISDASASVWVGYTVQLTASSLLGLGITWTTDASGVATVSSTGLVTGVSVGTATITATSAKGAFASCAVTVDPVPTYTLTVKDGSTVLDTFTDLPHGSSVAQYEPNRYISQTQIVFAWLVGGVAFDFVAGVITSNIEINYNSVKLFDGVITTATELKAIGDTASAKKNYILMNDIDFYDGDGGIGWCGSFITEFHGVLEGNGYAVKNLNLKYTGAGGGFVRDLYGTIRNLTFENVYYNLGMENYNAAFACGIVAGTVKSTGYLENIYINGCWFDVSYNEYPAADAAYIAYTVEAGAAFKNIVFNSDKGAKKQQYGATPDQVVWLFCHTGGAYSVNNAFVVDNGSSTANPWPIYGGTMQSGSSYIDSGNLAAMAAAMTGKVPASVWTTGSGTIAMINGCVAKAPTYTLTVKDGSTVLDTFTDLKAGSSIAAYEPSRYISATQIVFAWMVGGVPFDFQTDVITSDMEIDYNDVVLYDGTITTTTQLKAIADTAGAKKNYILMCDIDFGGGTAGLLWDIGGTLISEFHGILEGNGYAIKNLNLGYLLAGNGLIKNLYGTVRNLTFKNVWIDRGWVDYSLGFNCGIIAGTVKSTGRLENIFMNGCYMNMAWTDDGYNGGQSAYVANTIEAGAVFENIVFNSLKGCKGDWGSGAGYGVRLFCYTGGAYTTYNVFAVDSGASVFGAWPDYGGSPQNNGYTGSGSVSAMATAMTGKVPASVWNTSGGRISMVKGCTAKQPLSELYDGLIYTVADLQDIGKGAAGKFGTDSLSGSYLLMNDLDLSGVTGLAGWVSETALYLVGGQFPGTFDSNGYALTGLEMYSYYKGERAVFAHLTGVVKNTAFTGFKVNGTSYSAGVIASYFDGSIQNCYVQVEFTEVTTSYEPSGGIVGRYAWSSSLTGITNCIVDITTANNNTATDYTGSAIGILYYGATLTNVYVRNSGTLDKAVTGSYTVTDNGGGDFTTMGALLTAANTDGVFNGDIWDLSGSVPALVNGCTATE